MCASYLLPQGVWQQWWTCFSPDFQQFLHSLPLASTKSITHHQQRELKRQLYPLSIPSHTSCEDGKSIFRKEYLQKNNISLEKIKDNWVLSSLIPTKRIEKLIQIFISLKQTHTDVLTISQPLCCTTTVHSLGPFHGRIYVHSSPLQTTILELHPQKGATTIKSIAK